MSNDRIENQPNVRPHAREDMTLATVPSKIEQFANGVQFGVDFMKNAAALPGPLRMGVYLSVLIVICVDLVRTK
jgi:hypothetical protein